ncbi:MAG TPA: hypothetical protein GX396_05795 [Tissierellia bacterium]|nr:hypothetical protein [Tissierellia bacterium]
MDNNNPQNYSDYNMYYNDNVNNEVYGNRYDMYDPRFDPRYDRRYDQNFYPMRYYRYPYCDRYGRCENPIWWLFWPLFFM